MKGIILAGGTGTRLYPMTAVVCKQLLPVYDKPMIYYPLATLMQAGITDIMIICTPADEPLYYELFANGWHLGINIQYAVQRKPEGIAQAFVIAKRFINNEPVCLILGDNIFHGSGIENVFRSSTELTSGGLIFGYQVKDPGKYGVVEFKDNQVITIIEKPKNPKTNYAIPGIYFYDSVVTKIAESLTKSKRGEYEITDINNHYLEYGALKINVLDRGFCWLDTGTNESLHHASNYIQAIQERQGIMIGCIEEVALTCGYIAKDELKKLPIFNSKNDYGKYLRQLL